MTNAEEYATEECCPTCKNINHFCKEKCECWTFAKNGFLAGLNEGRLKWHKVADGDVPKVKRKVLVQLKDVEEPIFDYYREDGLWNYALENEVIAWCEIPQYEEE